MDPISITSYALSFVAGIFSVTSVSYQTLKALRGLEGNLGLENETPAAQNVKRRFGKVGVYLFSLCAPGVYNQLEHIESSVLRCNDSVLFEFKKSYINDCNMTSIAGAIITQVAITALSLPYLSQTHWIARASFVVSLCAGTLSVFFSVLLQRTIGALYEPRLLRAWLSELGHFPTVNQLNTLRQTWDNVPQAERTRQGWETFKSTFRTSFVEFDARQVQEGAASIFSAVILDIPRSMINLSLGAFLIGFAMYFGFLWARGLDTNAGLNDSRDVFITFIISVLCCIGGYSIPQTIKSRDEKVLEIYRRLRIFFGTVNANGTHSDATPGIRPAHEIPNGGTLNVGHQILAPENIALPLSSAASSVELSPLHIAIRRAMEAHQEAAKAEKALAEEYRKALESKSGANLDDR